MADEVKNRRFEVSPNEEAEVIRALRTGEIDAFVINNEVYTLTSAKKSLAEEKLLQQLKESHETLKAIRDGEVDALVMDNEVYLLSGSEKAYRLLIDELQQGIVTLTDGTIVFSNASFSRLVHVKPEALMAAQIQQFVPESDQALLRALIQKAKKDSSSGEITLTDSSGKSFPVRVSCYPIKLGRVRTVCLLITDLRYENALYETVGQLKLEKEARQELISLAEKLNASQKQLEALNLELARSNADLEQFAYAAAHDLQEPIRMIKIYAEFVREEAKGRIEPETLKFMDVIGDTAGRMSDMVKGLLVYARTSPDKDKFTSCDLNGALKKALDQLKLSIEESGARIRCEPLPILKCTDAQIAQVFQNLISNALKFQRAGESPEITVSAAKAEDAWIISVKDNGIGISPQYAGNLFKMFNRAHSSKEYPGTGIGLVTCKKIIEGHGGRIWFESKEGEGTVFLFTLPAVPA